MGAASDLPIERMREGTEATEIADTIFGVGVEVVTASYTGDIDSTGIYTNGDSGVPGVTSSDTGVVLSMGNAESVTNSSGSSNQSNSISSNTSSQNNNSDFDAAAAARTHDASYLDVGFIPDGNFMTMQFMLASEEYPEFQNSAYVDVVGVWVNGEQVQLDVGNRDTDPGNINTTNIINMFASNSNDDVNTEMDGLAITITLLVFDGDVNTIGIGIADASDNRYGSSLLIGGDTVQADLIAVSDDLNVYPDGTPSFNVLENDVSATNVALTIKHINGQPVSVGNTTILPTGQTVTPGSGGIFTVTSDGEKDIEFTYMATDGGDTNVGFVYATLIPCFVAGTIPTTPEGDVPVETLQPSEMVMTQDNGPQALRWIGTRNFVAEDDFAPILIRTGTFGQHSDVRVSPLQRVLVRDGLAELLFGKAEVLVTANDLVNAYSVIRQTGGKVTYVHLILDRHQVIFPEVLTSEGFLPGPRTTNSFEQEIVAGVYLIFPESDPQTSAGYSPATQLTLGRFETDLLRKVRAAA